MYLPLKLSEQSIHNIVEAVIVSGGNRSINTPTRLSQVHKFRHHGRRCRAAAGIGCDRDVFINIHAIVSCVAHHSAMQEKVANQQNFDFFEEKVPLALAGPTCICIYLHIDTHTHTYRKNVNCNEAAARSQYTLHYKCRWCTQSRYEFTMNLLYFAHFLHYFLFVNWHLFVFDHFSFRMLTAKIHTKMHLIGHTWP